MPKQLFSIFIISIFFTNANAQSPAKSVYFEVGTPGIASINYDMRLHKKNDGLGFRVGIGGVAIQGSGAVFIPLGLTYLIGKDSKNYFELGAGGTVLVSFDRTTNYNPSTGTTTTTSRSSDLNSSFGHLYFGYRYQPKESGFLFRAGLAPIFGSDFFIPYIPSLSFGYKF
jgi:hypothetical protein